MASGLGSGNALFSASVSKSQMRSWLSQAAVYKVLPSGLTARNRRLRVGWMATVSAPSGVLVGFSNAGPFFAEGSRSGNSGMTPSLATLLLSALGLVDFLAFFVGSGSDVLALS